jgi:RNA methyltransferase, TrmH family
VVATARTPRSRSQARTRALSSTTRGTEKSTPAATTDYSAADLRGPLAIVMGSEQYGLSDFWLKEADLPVRIPMAGQADSLNVAMAAIITLFEAVRQRG